MRVVLFRRSAPPDRDHGGEHFLRGVLSELRARGASVRMCEPASGPTPMRELEPLLEGADLVLVHASCEPDLVARIGRVRVDGGPFRLFLHDTGVEDPFRRDLDGYELVLAAGAAVARRHERDGMPVVLWHEAADVRVFRPGPRGDLRRDVCWIGSWGEGERAASLRAFLLGPAADLGLTGTVHGVRWPDRALEELRAAGLAYRGWLPNYRVPDVYAAHRVTVHLPRAASRSLPTSPSIRPFEALACGIPLVAAAWDDEDGLFTAGADYLAAHDGPGMRRHLADVLRDPALAASLATHGLETIRARHTCAHRVDALVALLHADLPPLHHPLPAAAVARPGPRHAEAS